MGVTSRSQAAKERVVPEQPQSETTTLYFGQAIATATSQAMAADPRVFVYAQGINDPGGYFGSTLGLKDKFGEARCFDVPLSEESLIGLGVGASILGQRPMYVALRIEFMLLAMNQIINHAAKWSSMSGGKANAPLTIRALIGRGWGQGGQHAGAFFSVFGNFPGIQVVLPATPADAGGLLLTALTTSTMPTLILEPKPLYEVSGPVQLPFAPIPFGQAEIVRPGEHITFVALSYMVEFALTVAKRLVSRGISAEVINLRTISPFDEAILLASVQRTHNVAVFDIGWERFGLAAEVARILAMNGCRLDRPLLSAVRLFEHTPAGCFLEDEHYPKEEDVIMAISSAFGASNSGGE